MERAGALAGSNFITGTIEGIYTTPVASGTASSATTDAGRAENATVGGGTAAVKTSTPPKAAAKSAGKVVSKVRIDGQEHDVDVVVVALGPWSNLASAWLPLPQAVSAQKYHSAVLAPSDPVRARWVSLLNTNSAGRGYCFEYRRV
jgi:glycine/D-amino acid oxidase-like deaminating enzyme